MNSTVQTVLMLVLGAGGATFIWTVARSYIAIKESAETREAAAIKNLEKWREDADRRADRLSVQLSYANDLTHYYQTRVGHLEFLMHQAGVVVPPPPPRPVEPVLLPNAATT